MVPLTPERKAQLDDYARRHGQEPAAALDDVLADALEWERQDYQQASKASGRDTQSSRQAAAPRRGSLRGTAPEAWPSALNKPHKQTGI
jgi:hypothetical protein